MTATSKLSDEEHFATLLEKLRVNPTLIHYDDKGHLLHLDLSRTNLTQLPPEIGQLTQLQTLNLANNQLTQLPPEIGQLAQLQTLNLANNQLTQIPPEIGQLAQLQTLLLTNNQLTQIPPEIGQLTQLQKLFLESNHLNQLPPEIGQLVHLEMLYLANNQLTQLLPEIGQLAQLKVLYLANNQLTQLLPEIGQLAQLKVLYLANNQLTQLPPEMGQLAQLRELSSHNNPHLLTPPPEIMARGLAAILNFLRELQEDSETRYQAKLILVGEGGTGKSSLLRALRGEPFVPDLATTHGVEVGDYTLPHPRQSMQALTLNTWDFGGQTIYHATHQFFLTQRSLYVIVWNARLEAEQGRLNYWFDTIQALAPDAPVLLVATHIDERAPDLNYQLYTEAFPQLRDNLSLSNKTGAGLPEVKKALAKQAAALPLMGQPWPRKWLNVEQALVQRPEHHLSLESYKEICARRGVDEEIAAGSLGNLLHDLGKILYFSDDPQLCNLVVLKPNWVTKAISLVLTDEPTRAAHGILLHSELPRIWASEEQGRPYERHLYPIFLRLMERFDLSYQIEAEEPGDSPSRSLVPQLLPHEPPIQLPPWPTLPPIGESQVEMVYRFDFVPAGIMSWFIVRTHRYTTNLHWRDGVLLGYHGHDARVELNPLLRELRLLVTGVSPHNFFTILKNTLDLLLARFEGLRVSREVPCICHWQRQGEPPCGRFYPYDDLVRRMERGRYMVECPETFEQVSVRTLLFGIHESTLDEVMVRIEENTEKIAAGTVQIAENVAVIIRQNEQMSELLNREFTRHWNLEMQKLEAECPSTFFLMPGDERRFNPKNWVSQEYRLHLVCQHPPQPHGVDPSYSLRQPVEWWTTVSPWLNHAIRFLKYAVPMGKVIGAFYDEEAMKALNARAELMEKMVSSLPTMPGLDSGEHFDERPRIGQDEHAVGAALRALCTYLTEVDKPKYWGGLERTLTPDGNILWLCHEHRQPYEVRALVLE